jgi:hypothetical protein
MCSDSYIIIHLLFYVLGYIILTATYMHTPFNYRARNPPWPVFHANRAQI